MGKTDAVKKKVSFSQFGHYNVLFEYFITHGLQQDYVTPPAITKRTMELGNRHSPDFVCSPFKFTLGCFLEAIEAGADTIVQVGGVVACRLKYYGALQERIIKDLGHDITFVNLARADRAHPRSFLALLKELNPHCSLPRILWTGLTVLAMLEALDRTQAQLSGSVGFELTDGDYDRAFGAFLQRLRAADNNVPAVYKIYKQTKKEMAAIPVNVPADPIRIAVIGEYYTVMDDYSSHNIEKKMAKYGMYVARWMNVSNTLVHYSIPKRRRVIKDYVKYDMGVTTTSNIGFALTCAKQVAVFVNDGPFGRNGTDVDPHIRVFHFLFSLSFSFFMRIIS